MIRARILVSLLLVGILGAIAPGCAAAAVACGAIAAVAAGTTGYLVTQTEGAQPVDPSAAACAARLNEQTATLGQLTICTVGKDGERDCSSSKACQDGDNASACKRCLDASCCSELAGLDLLSVCVLGCGSNPSAPPDCAGFDTAAASAYCQSQGVSGAWPDPRYDALRMCAQTNCGSCPELAQ
jgi:hypothetical protein